MHIEYNDPIDVEADAIYFDYYWMSYLDDDAWITLGDLSIQGNIIDAGGDGMEVVYELGFYLYDNSALTIGDTYIVDNDVDAYGVGVYLPLEYIGYGINGTATVAFGNITIERNDVHATNYDAIYVSGPYECGYYLYGHSAVTMGDINIVDNNVGIVADNGDGIRIDYYEWGYKMYDYSMASFGDVNIEGNIIDAHDYGIYTYYDYCAFDNSHNSNVTWGDVRVVDNQVTSDSHGLYIEYEDNDVGSRNKHDSYARLPKYVITGNTFDVAGDGIFFETSNNPDDNSGNATVEFGGFLIDDNSFSCDHGSYFNIDDFCYECSGNALTTMGDVDITDNEFYGLDSDAIYIHYDELQCNPEDNSTLWVGALTIASNVIDGASNGTRVDYSTVYGAENSTTTMGTLDITGNNICNVTNDGIYVSYYLDAEDSSTVTVGRALIQDNTLDGSCDNGVYMYMYAESAPNATASLGDPVIDGNTIENWQTGIYLEEAENVTVTNNFIKDNGDGIYLEGSDYIQILYNDILSNKGTASGVHLDDNCLGKTVVNCNNIMGNLPYGVYTAFATVNAINNWWGSASGPSTSPGSGDRVSTNVTYSPWLPNKFQYCPVCGGTPVGGEANPINKAPVLVPLIVLGTAIIAAATIFMRRRRAA